MSADVNSNHFHWFKQVYDPGGFISVYMVTEIVRFGGQVLPIQSKLGASAFSGFYSWLVESCIGCTYQIRLKLKVVKDWTQYIASELAFALRTYFVSYPPNPHTHHVEHKFEPSSEGYWKVSWLPQGSGTGLPQGFPKNLRSTSRVWGLPKGFKSFLSKGYSNGM